MDTSIHTVNKRNSSSSTLSSGKLRKERIIPKTHYRVRGNINFLKTNEGDDEKDDCMRGNTGTLSMTEMTTKKKKALKLCLQSMYSFKGCRV